MRGGGGREAYCRGRQRKDKRKFTHFLCFLALLNKQDKLKHKAFEG
jgi:hypothetical protein